MIDGKNKIYSKFLREEILSLIYYLFSYSRPAGRKRRIYDAKSGKILSVFDTAAYPQNR